MGGGGGGAGAGGEADATDGLGGSARRRPTLET